MMKQKFYEYVDKYLMAMGIDIEEFAELKETTLRWIALMAAMECQNMFDWAWDIEESCDEGGESMETYTPDFDDPKLADKLRILLDRREERLAAQA